MDKMDLYAGLIGGLQKGIGSYWDAQSSINKENADMASKGLIYNKELGKWENDPAVLAKERQKRIQEARFKAALEGQDVEFDNETGDIKSMKYRPDYIEMKKQIAQQDSEKDPYGLKAMAASEARRKAEQANKGERLPSDKVLAVQQGAQIPNELKNVSGAINDIREQMGPIEGRLRSMNPYDTTFQAAKAKIKTASQQFGRYMEGGVLRKEDEKKYENMFPQPSDTPEVADEKLANVERMMVEKHNADIDALKTSGYDTTAFNKQTPGLLVKKDKKKSDVAGRLLQQSAGAAQFPVTLKKDGMKATASNPDELKEMQAEGWN